MTTDRNIILIEEEHHDEAKVVDMNSLDSEQLKEYREELEALGSFPVRRTKCSRLFQFCLLAASRLAIVFLLRIFASALGINGRKNLSSL